MNKRQIKKRLDLIDRIVYEMMPSILIKKQNNEIESHKDSHFEKIIGKDQERKKTLEKEILAEVHYSLLMNDAVENKYARPYMDIFENSILFNGVIENYVSKLIDIYSKSLEAQFDAKTKYDKSMNFHNTKNAVWQLKRNTIKPIAYAIRIAEESIKSNYEEERQAIISIEDAEKIIKNIYETCLNVNCTFQEKI